MKMKKKQTEAQREARMEREGQTTLPEMPHHSRRGGARPGAGRKPVAIGGSARPHSVWCTDVEYEEIKRYLARYRQRHAHDDDGKTVAAFEIPASYFRL